MTATTAIASVPALGAALRGWDAGAPFASPDAALSARALVPMYRLGEGSVSEEAHAAAQMAVEVAERLRRLPRAYGEWQVFEPGPYFDLSHDQVAALTRVSERVSTVHVVFYVDALLPAFQRIQNTAATFAQAAAGSEEQNEMIYATLATQWQRMLDVIDGARRQLSHDIGFLGFSGGAEEQERWMQKCRSTKAECSLPWCSTDRRRFPSLTLSVDFPLPAYRQPGRKRRLRRAWQRRYGQSDGDERGT